MLLGGKAHPNPVGEILKRSKTILGSMVLRKKEDGRRLGRTGFCLMEGRTSGAQVRQINAHTVRQSETRQGRTEK